MNIAAAMNLYCSWRADRPSLGNQRIERVATGGEWAVVDPDGYVISTWQTEEEAEAAAWPIYKGILPSATGPTGGARVKKLSAADIFQDTEYGDKTRAAYLKHPKPQVVKLADWLRDGDQRPSSAGGAAGTGGAGGPSGGGG
jgi:hypothetical protein